MTDDKKQSPLDLLEDVLQDAKSASQAKKATLQDEADQKKTQELAVLREQKKVEEAKLIQEQLDKMQEIKQTPAAQARRDQDKTELARSEDEESSQDGYEIHQLEHQKV